jgi:hypothetical protein
MHYPGFLQRMVNKKDGKGVQSIPAFMLNKKETLTQTNEGLWASME